MIEFILFVFIVLLFLSLVAFAAAFFIYLEKHDEYMKREDQRFYRMIYQHREDMKKIRGEK